jgi:hypothetical protein
VIRLDALELFAGEMKRFTFSASVTVVAATLLTPTVEASAGNSVLDGSVSWTAVSGDTGSESKVVGSDTDVRAAYSIRWWEDSDDPCKFRVYNRHINLGGIQEPEKSWCDGSPGNEKWAERRGANEYITALQVCLTDKKDSTKNKVKGLRVWGRTLTAGTLGPENGPDEDKHTHCKQWSNKVSCGTGKIATKIKVYYNEYQWSSHGFATGIALGCRDVDPK